MTRGYRIGYQKRHRWRKLAGVMLISVTIFGGLLGYVIWDMNSKETTQVEGGSRQVAQQEDVKAAVSKSNVSEPTFSFDLPQGWKEIDRKSNQRERSITWQSKIKKEDNRWFKVYYDVIPANFAVNRLLPIDVSNNKISYRQLSDNCKNFTTAKKDNNVALASKWQGLEFICDLPNFVQNKVGTGTEGAINATSITGEQKGTHKYFFVYTDHNIHPDYQTFYDMLKSFQAK